MLTNSFTQTEKRKVEDFMEKRAANMVLEGIRLGIVSKDVLHGKRPLSFDERMKLDELAARQGSGR